jgi:hypothetical protein
MFTLFAMFTIFEIVFFSVFAVFLFLGIFLDDKSDHSEFKWFVIVIGAIATAVYYWSEWSSGSILSVFTESNFLQNIGIYLAAGLGFAIVKFFLEIKKSANYFAASWKDYSKTATIDLPHANDAIYVQKLKNFFDVKDGEKTPQTVSFLKAQDFYHTIANDETLKSDDMFSKFTIPSWQAALNNAVEKFCNRSYLSYSVQKGRKFISMQLGKDESFQPKPSINKAKLSSFISAWTILWPFYLVVMILGDIVANIFEWVTEIINAISFKAVEKIFQSAFK